MWWGGGACTALGVGETLHSGDLALSYPRAVQAPPPLIHHHPRPYWKIHSFPFNSGEYQVSSRAEIIKRSSCILKGLRRRMPICSPMRCSSQSWLPVMTMIGVFFVLLCPRSIL